MTFRKGQSPNPEGRRVEAQVKRAAHPAFAIIGNFEETYITGWWKRPTSTALPSTCPSIADMIWARVASAPRLSLVSSA